jgi:flavin-binding protein dodecin
MTRMVVSTTTAQTSGTIHSEKLKSKENVMTQKVIDIVGTSKESFAKAAENAVAEAAKTVRDMRWARVGGVRNGTRRQEDSQVPRHNKDLLQH